MAVEVTPEAIRPESTGAVSVDEEQTFTQPTDNTSTGAVPPPPQVVVSYGFLNPGAVEKPVEVPLSAPAKEPIRTKVVRPKKPAAPKSTPAETK